MDAVVLRFSTEILAFLGSLSAFG